MDEKIMKETGKLGFGLMRLPHKGLSIDIEQTSKMVDMFIEAGGTYFDTAHVYPGSEAAAKKALVDRYPRDSYTLATKLNAGMAAVSPTEKAAKKQFYTSLERTGAEYFDYYLLHALDKDNLKRYEKFGIWDFVREQKEKGLIRHMGFSFHDQPEILEKILREAEEVVNVQETQRRKLKLKVLVQLAQKAACLHLKFRILFYVNAIVVHMSL
jgi:predicted aldo/keto reductase-like oxidoreductase